MSSTSNSANTIYIGLGSNLSEPFNQLLSALTEIDNLSDTQLIKCSSFYSSKPMGPQDQPDYVNAVAEIASSLAPMALLSRLQKIEHLRGRNRDGGRWTARTLDLDILLIGNEIIQMPDLLVPHPGIKEREFVLYPLHEIAPDLQFPCGNSLKSVLKKVSRNGLFVIEKEIKWGKELK